MEERRGVGLQWVILTCLFTAAITSLAVGLIAPRFMDLEEKIKENKKEEESEERDEKETLPTPVPEIRLYVNVWKSQLWREQKESKIWGSGMVLRKLQKALLSLSLENTAGDKEATLVLLEKEEKDALFLNVEAVNMINNEEAKSVLTARLTRGNRLIDLPEGEAQKSLNGPEPSLMEKEVILRDLFEKAATSLAEGLEDFIIAEAKAKREPEPTAIGQNSQALPKGITWVNVVGWLVTLGMIGGAIAAAYRWKKKLWPWRRNAAANSST